MIRPSPTTLGIAEGSADAEDDPQEIRRQSRREQVHADADDDRIAAEDRRAIGEDQRKDGRRGHRRGDAAERAVTEIAADDRSEGADQHLALEREIEHANPSAQDARKRGEKDRRDRLSRGLEQKRRKKALDHIRRPSPRRMARKRITIACKTSVSTRGTEVSRCMAKPPVCSAAKKRAATIAPTGSPLTSKRRHQPGPGVGRREQRPVDEPELRAEHDDRPDEAGDRAAREHGPYGLPSKPHAAVSGEARVLAPHPQFVTRARPPVDEDDGERDRRDEETADVERSGQDVKARVRRDHEGLRQSGRNVAKGKAREIGGDADRRVAQEQARDQHRDAVPDLAPGRERGVEAAAEPRERQSDRGAERAVTRKKQRRERADKAADDELAVAAEVHHAAAQRDGGGKRHSDKRRRPIERVRQGSRR